MMRKVKPKVDEFAVGPSLNTKKSEPRYPTIRLDLDVIPEAKDWKIGDMYRIDLGVKMVGISQSRFDNSAEFEIRKIDGRDADEKDDDDKEDGDKGGDNESEYE